MKILIGILILLFVLTTIGFSGTAFAGHCDYLFAYNGPSYERETFEEYQAAQHESEFIHSNSSSFLENRRNEDESSWSEFGNQINNNRDWDKDESF